MLSLALVIAALDVQRRAFRGYPIVATMTAAGVPDGETVTVQRRVGRSWRRLTTATASSGVGYAVLALPAGSQRIRLSATVGAQSATSEVYTVDVVRPRGWTTPRRDVGRYTGKGEGLPVELKVARAGRRVRDFEAQVSTFCLGGTVGLSIGICDGIADYSVRLRR
jgi:hypothetical protein